ncbi:MAG: [FeFe] hydrogenase H-cluster radical SAM maturase HydE [Chitinivibrionia bacterium]|nr:[FeFe] hydrogenase H-cluster radical SAM maturase HydE [Chitinivibrionia bacterium]
MFTGEAYTKDAALRLLASEGEDLLRLYQRADEVRKEKMGDEVFIRGIIEFSNICARNCHYCGIRAGNKGVSRYAMDADEILETAYSMVGTEKTTVVLQSGETPAFTDEELGEIIRRIKGETGLSVTLSVGSRPLETYRYWHDCGMDRYLLRFETSDPELFRRLRPGSTLEERLRCLYDLKAAGVQTGSGFMIGLPGETLQVLADNILLCRTLDLDMIGIGPFIPHPDTPLGDEKNAYDDNREMFFKAIAVLRIFNPDAHIPATTAFDAVFPDEGRNRVLKVGGNIFMPNNTPLKYRKDYLLYPGKPCITESAEVCTQCAVMRIQAMGRKIGTGPGHSIKKRT